MHDVIQRVVARHEDENLHDRLIVARIAGGEGYYHDHMAALTWDGWTGMCRARLLESVEDESWEARADQLVEGDSKWLAACRRLNKPVFVDRQFDHAGELAGSETWIGDGLALVPFFGILRYHECTESGAAWGCDRLVHHHPGPGGVGVECDAGADCPRQTHGHVTQSVYVAKAERKPVVAGEYVGNRWVPNPRFAALRGGVPGPRRRGFTVWVWDPESVVGPFHDVDDAEQVIVEWRAQARQANAEHVAGFGDGYEILVDPDVLVTLRSSMERDGVDAYEALGL